MYLFPFNPVGVHLCDGFHFIILCFVYQINYSYSIFILY
nr:MAG TPA: hypothetical protein [Caudoviricetes sp.]